MRINDGREDRVAAPLVSSRVFQLKAEEARVQLGVVEGTYRIHFLSIFIVYVFGYVIIREIPIVYSV